jgi:molybdopterin molybdotransferase
MISFDDALAVIGSAAKPLGTEMVALDHAVGRVLAAPVIAAIDSPRADVSAMDGYAVRGDDLGKYPLSLKMVGESFPGRGGDGVIGPGSCVRIFTGAPLPAGGDRIVIQERVRRDGDAIIIEVDPGPATWVRPRGRDFRAGDEVLAAGHQLDPAAMIAAAGADVADVQVHVSPRVALLSNGDELVEPGEARASALAVPDSASLGVAALAVRWGAEIVNRVRLADDLAELRTAADKALACADMVVVIGGASVGDRDFAKAMFESAGLELLFSSISIRPGKPAWFGRVGEKLVLGLPGNPTSALVTARLLLAPSLAAMQGRSVEQALRWEQAHLADPLPPCDQRETFHRGCLAGGEVSLLGFQESHAQKALAEADVLVRQPANSAAAAAGEVVPVLRL